MGFSRQEIWSGLLLPSPNRLQVSLKILCCYADTWFHLNLTFLKFWANQFVFLMEMFFLSYVNETMYLLWNLPFFKMVLPKTNFFSFLKPWADNSSTNQYPCQFFLWPGDNTPCAFLSQKCILWERGLVKLPQPWDVSLIWLIAF